jgi:DNA-3-methyladenine glycosylase
VTPDVAAPGGDAPPVSQRARSALARPRRSSFGAGLLERDALEVAPALLGAHLCVTSGEGAVVVRITEVEAYRGGEDPGSHAFRGRTARNAAMFGAGGHLYVYFTYGMHWCANVVCGSAGAASAVLLRAGEVVEGRELAAARRPATRRAADLARGPACLARALGLTGDDDGAAIAVRGRSAASDPVPRVALIPPAERTSGHRRGPRVGLSGAGGDGEAFPWRFWLPGEPTVSAYRPAPARSGRPAAPTPGRTAD